MTTDAVDCVVVGGGVAGLMTAVRLAGTGRRVVVLERDLLGSGSTTGNHGMLHSGALYARWHPQIVAACQHAQRAYASSFPDCMVPAESGWYVGSSQTMRTYEALWRSHGIIHREVALGEIRELIRDARAVRACAVDELIIDTRSLLIDLAARCVSLGVEIAVGVGAQRVVIDNGDVRAVETAREHIATPNVVLCAGIGTANLLRRSGSLLGDELRSRLEMMVAFPGRLPRQITGLEFGWPAVAPTVAATVLASRYGASQRWVNRPGRWPVPAAEAAALGKELSQWFTPGLIDHGDGVAWVCSKTEHTGAGPDQWGTAPNYAVFNHSTRENITGLWTVLPGKMTLALHASRDVTSQITDITPPLELSPHTAVPDERVAELVAVSPWAAHHEVQLR